jgi:hypothetical protein
MTVSSTTDRKLYTGDDATVAFATSPVVFFDETDLEVYIITIATGASAQQTLTTDYTVSGGAGSTGTVTMLTAPASTEKLLIKRVVPATQPSDFVNNDASDAEVVEDALDRLTMIAQQKNADSDYPIRLSDAETPTDALTHLPFDRASKFLAFNASKELVASDGSDGTEGALAVALAASTGSSIVGFAQSGTGAIAGETVEDALRRFVHTAQYDTAANYATARDALTGTIGINDLDLTGNYLKFQTEVSTTATYGMLYFRVPGETNECLRVGWNLGALGALIDASDNQLYLGFESNWEDDPILLEPVSEMYLRARPIGGGDYVEPLFIQLVRSDNEIYQITMQASNVIFRNSDKTVEWFRMSTGVNKSSSRLDCSILTGEGDPGAPSGCGLRVIRNSVAGAGVNMSLVAGSTGTAAIHFGDNGSATIGGITYDNSVNRFSFTVGSGARFYIDTNGNIMVGTNLVGTNAAQTLVVETGTAPSDAPADTVAFYSSDLSAGNTIPSFYCEGTGHFATGTPAAATGSVAIRLNGTVYHFTVSDTAAS